MEPFLEVSPVFRLQHGWKEREQEEFAIKDPKKSKILQFALPKIQTIKLHPASLWATINAPSLVLKGIGTYLKPKRPQFFEEENAWVSTFSDPYSLKPVGIPSPPHNSWVCSFLQFIIAIPSLCEMFSFAPKSLVPFLDFFEKYRKAQKENKKILEEEPKAILGLLRKKFPSWFCQKKVSILDIFSLLEKLMEALPFNEFSSKGARESSLLALHPFARLPIQSSQVGKICLQSWVESYLNQYFPPELLVGYKEASSNELRSSLQPSLITYKGEYHLLAFMEYRPEGLGEKGDYVTYISVNGAWYQCFYHHVLKVKKENLSLVLKRGVLFYYQKEKRPENRWSSGLF